MELKEKIGFDDNTKSGAAWKIMEKTRNIIENKANELMAKWNIIGSIEFSAKSNDLGDVKMSIIVEDTVKKQKVGGAAYISFNFFEDPDGICYWYKIVDLNAKEIANNRVYPEDLNKELTSTIKVVLDRIIE